MTRRIAVLSLVFVLMLSVAVVATAESHVRIVRLSYIDGNVQMDRATGSGLERAILNTPIVQGTRIVTGDGGLAEVEFEDQSALRIASNSDIRFSQLLVNDAGAKVNEIKAADGVLYLDTRAKGQDIYRIIAEGQTFVVRPDSQARLEIAPERLQLAVFKGNAFLEKELQPVEVKRRETLTLNPHTSAAYELAKGIDTLPEDNWNQERRAYASAYARNAGYGGPGSGYGLEDLNYYGDFFYKRGFGYLWQPYGLAGYGSLWDPYSNGAWVAYPTVGYAWASAYPWGWLPYHYGSWVFVNGIGWAWSPGGGYNGAWYYNNFQPVVIATGPNGWRPTRPPVRPGRPSPAPTILVGNSIRAASVAGGRAAPDFASVIPGRAPRPAAPNAVFAAPNTRTTAAAPFARPTPVTRPQNGHVFVPPARAATPGWGGGPIGRAGAPVGVGGAGPAVGAPSTIGRGAPSAGAAPAHAGGGGVPHR